MKSLRAESGGVLVNVVLILAVLVSIASTVAYAWNGEVLLAIVSGLVSTLFGTGVFLVMAPIAPSNHEEMR